MMWRMMLAVESELKIKEDRRMVQKHVQVNGKA